jgi:hypothetical protein
MDVCPSRDGPTSVLYRHIGVAERICLAANVCPLLCVPSCARGAGKSFSRMYLEVCLGSVQHSTPGKMPERALMVVHDIKVTSHAYSHACFIHARIC